ncbi:MAG: MaoC family dehydratase [Aquabacterium sp.]
MPTADADILYWWEDFGPGSVYAYGPLTVLREATLAFAQDFDPQPFHLDDAAAQASLFGRLSASGWHTCALTMRMACDAFLLRSSSLGAPGIDELRWLKPVYPGDTLSGRITALAARRMASRPGVGLVHLQWETVNQHAEPVLAMKSHAMFRCRDAAVAG